MDSAALKALGIEAASFAKQWRDLGFGIRELGTGFGNKTWERGENKSEQRYSGKPDGFAGTPKKKTTVNGLQTTDLF